MSEPEATAKTASGGSLSLVRRLTARFRFAALAGAALLAVVCLAAAGAVAQDKAPEKPAAAVPATGQGKAPDQASGTVPAVAPVKAPEKLTNEDCLGCHLDPTTTRVVNGKTESLVFPKDAFARSVHAKLACVDCHTTVKELVHDPLPPPTCTGCHDKEVEQYASSIHGVSHMMGASGAASAGIATARTRFCRSRMSPRRSSR